ncbi:MAG: hypothetical protein AB1861_01080 [Cyanobacteriota bacterium]
MDFYFKSAELFFWGFVFPLHEAFWSVKVRLLKEILELMTYNQLKNLACINYCPKSLSKFEQGLSKKAIIPVLYEELTFSTPDWQDCDTEILGIYNDD